MLDDAVCLEDAEFAGQAEVWNGGGVISLEDVEESTVEEGLGKAVTQADVSSRSAVKAARAL